MIEIAGIGPVPFACGQLEDMGATVVRMERRGPSSSLPASLAAIGRKPRPTVFVDLKDSTDRQIATTLISHADVLVDPFRPGVAERLGIGPDTMCHRNPRLVYARMTGWGQEGPYAQMAGHDINYIGLAGSLAAIGSTDVPVPPLNLVGDYGGGAMFAVAGILAALVERASTGRGQVLDVAMVDGAAALLGPIRDLHNAGMWSMERQRNLLDGGAPFYSCYRTADDEFVAVGALESQFYSKLVSGLDLDEANLGNRLDPTEWPGIRRLFAETFATRTREEWTEIFDGTDACVTPVLAMDEVDTHRHNVARDALVDSDSGLRPHPAPRFEVTEPSSAASAHTRDSAIALLTSLGIERGAADSLVQNGSVTWD